MRTNKRKYIGISIFTVQLFNVGIIIKVVNFLHCLFGSSSLFDHCFDANPCLAKNFVQQIKISH